MIKKLLFYVVILWSVSYADFFGIGVFAEYRNLETKANFPLNPIRYIKELDKLDSVIDGTVCISIENKDCFTNVSVLFPGLMIRAEKCCKNHISDFTIRFGIFNKHVSEREENIISSVFWDISSCFEYKINRFTGINITCKYMDRLQNHRRVNEYKTLIYSPESSAWFLISGASLCLKNIRAYAGCGFDFGNNVIRLKRLNNQDVLLMPSAIAIEKKYNGIVIGSLSFLHKIDKNFVCKMMLYTHYVCDLGRTSDVYMVTLKESVMSILLMVEYVK